MTNSVSRKKCVKGIFTATVYILMGFVMLLTVCVVPVNVGSAFVRIVVKIAVGATVYLAECGALWKLKPSLMPDIVGGPLLSVGKKLKIVK